MTSVFQAKTIREFDQQFTSVMFGYRTIDDYYADASPCRRLKRIGIPVLCLNSLDDVFSPDHGKLIPPPLPRCTWLILRKNFEFYLKYNGKIVLSWAAA